MRRSRLPVWRSSCRPKWSTDPRHRGSRPLSGPGAGRTSSTGACRSGAWRARLKCGRPARRPCTRDARTAALPPLLPAFVGAKGSNTCAEHAASCAHLLNPHPGSTSSLRPSRLRTCRWTWAAVSKPALRPQRMSRPEGVIERPPGRSPWSASRQCRGRSRPPAACKRPMGQTGGRSGAGNLSPRARRARCARSAARRRRAGPIRAAAALSRL
jgi:hypothetical protein